VASLTSDDRPGDTTKGAIEGHQEPEPVARRSGANEDARTLAGEPTLAASDKASAVSDHVSAHRADQRPALSPI